ncbi:AMP-dependent synthetase/ligase [Solitalea koreensis]|uniref:Long-chain acyl-CoA synthetase n=1 Tax=Solitalea koreensis TaxID=543615 RepID=A0A521AM59_9SPHI|nr:long-chain fatty acid--CoA ligase [Solitalea koreensis]SMO35897.1 long-chain acyl-CoA synthetase [Solitalea koreensis]
MQVNTIMDLLNTLPQRYKGREVVAGKKEGVWVKYSAEQFRENVDNVSLGLLALGMGADDKIANMSPNRPEWNFVDFGIMQIGARHVPLYPTLAENDLKFIINDAEVKIIFVASKELYDKVQSIRAEVPSLKEVYTYEDVPGAKSWKEVKALANENDRTQLKALSSNISPDDLLTLIYTSGTTGNPKGVMLTHGNLVSNIVTCHKLCPSEAQIALSFLPLSHIFERMIVYMHMFNSLSVYYAESIDTISANLQELKPDCFSTVPRLLEKVYDRIVAKGNELTGIKKTLFFWALNLGLKYDHDGKNGWWYGVQLQVARKLIFSKWQAALGGNIKVIVSGGAALQERLARIFWAAGIPVLEGYGLTETSPVIAVNTFDRQGHCFGTVGKIINGVEVKFAEDGEILCKGPNIMNGYYKRPEQTAEAITDGWFHTGDIGVLVDGKYLKITDRKKEIFKTAGGKYIAPQVIENKLKESVYIEQIMIIGENQRFPAAFIVPTFVNLIEWCARNNVEYTTNEAMVKNPDVIAKYQQELDKYNVGFGKWETVKKFVLLPREWSIDEGEMTPKLSLKRKIIMEKNKNLIEAIYAHSEPVVA